MNLCISWSVAKFILRSTVNKTKIYHPFHRISTVNHVLRQAYLCMHSHPISLSKGYIQGAPKSPHGPPLVSCPQLPLKYTHSSPTICNLEKNSSEVTGPLNITMDGQNLPFWTKKDDGLKRQCDKCPAGLNMLIPFTFQLSLCCRLKGDL